MLELPVTLYPIGRPVRATVTLYHYSVRPVRATVTLYPIGRPVRATVYLLYPIGIYLLELLLHCIL